MLLALSKSYILSCVSVVFVEFFPFYSTRGEKEKKKRKIFSNSLNSDLFSRPFKIKQEFDNKSERITTVLNWKAKRELHRVFKHLCKSKALQI